LFKANETNSLWTHKWVEQIGHGFNSQAVYQKPVGKQIE